MNLFCICGHTKSLHDTGWLDVNYKPVPDGCYGVNLTNPYLTNPYGVNLKNPCGCRKYRQDNLKYLEQCYEVKHK